jgi:hypothetical protein
MPNTPRLRTVDKIKPPYQLNKFPSDFGHKLGKEIVYLLATKSVPTVEGPEWEQIFANCIEASWKPSNVGLDDIILGVCAWGAKTVKAINPHAAKSVRLISGRNSPAYSFDEMELNRNPQAIGKDVLQIWNARVEALRNKFSHLRTVVLIKSTDLTKLTVFEIETILYPVDRFVWSRNQRGNLEANDLDGNHRFTWQPHGSQFTIIEEVPKGCLLIEVKPPPRVDKDELLRAVKFDKSWVKVITRS